jgi:hypothetical protein
MRCSNCGDVFLENQKKCNCSYEIFIQKTNIVAFDKNISKDDIKNDFNNFVNKIKNDKFIKDN